MLNNVLIVILVSLVVFVFGAILIILKWYHKAEQGQALVRTGVGGTRVSFAGIFVVPVLHRLELMDISIKTVVIARMHKEGLICKDNMRADIKVTFFVRVNKTQDDVIQVGQSIGCRRASDKVALEELFDAKFAEALKTVGKKFDFIELYNSRDQFKHEILQIIGTDLNGYILDDCAIDYLEQTSIHELKEDNILDSEGIKKIIELTSKQKILANHLEREKEKTITQQDVQAREAVLEMQRQLAETEEKQKREVAAIRAREEAETAVIQQQELLKSAKARIQTEEESQVAEENKERQVIVARKNKERIEAVETERVTKDQLLEVTERERIVTLAQIAKEKSVEEERKNIQEVIRERVAVQKSVVTEEELTKDIQAFALAEREKAVAIKNAEKLAEEALVQQIKAADALRQAAEYRAKQLQIEADAEQATAAKRAEALKILAEAETVKAAALGLAEANVLQAKSIAKLKDGEVEASIIEKKAIAEAKGIQVTAEAQADADEKLGLVAAKVNKEKGLVEAEIIEAKAEANEKQGLVEVKIMNEKSLSDAAGVAAKADAMRKLDGVGKEHEEYKLQLEQQKTIRLAEIAIQKDISEAQAKVLAEALKAAKIDIVGGENTFFEKIVGSITTGKSIDRLLTNSGALTDVKNALLPTNGNGNGNGHHHDGVSFKNSVKRLMDQFGLSGEDLKNLTIAALLLRLNSHSTDGETKELLKGLTASAHRHGFAEKPADSLGI